MNWKKGIAVALSAITVMAMVAKRKSALFN